MATGRENKKKPTLRKAESQTQAGRRTAPPVAQSQASPATAASARAAGWNPGMRSDAERQDWTQTEFGGVGEVPSEAPKDVDREAARLRQRWRAKKARRKRAA